MPLFVLPALGSIAAGTAAAIKVTANGLGLALLANEISQIVDKYLSSDAWRDLLFSRINPLIVQEVFIRTGLQLDEADPFSKVSFAAAISSKIGIQLTDISDRNQVMIDLGQATTELINMQTGMTLPALRLNDSSQLRAAFKDEITKQAVDALAGQLSLLDNETLAIIKAAALADAFGQPAPTVTPTKKQLQQRAASRAYYNREYTAGRRRVWQAKPTTP